MTTPVAWNGDAATCAAGSLDEVARLRSLALVNTYRFLAGLPELRTESRWKTAAQSCALLAHANNKLDHHPPKNWSCWSELGADASAVSLVANRSSQIAVEAYIEDPGNESTMVHRRWLFLPNLKRIAFGSTNKFSCITVDGRAFDTLASAVEAFVVTDTRTKSDADGAAAEFAAWPPKGVVPLEALRATKVDTAGWTVQSSTVDLDKAKVEVQVDGVVKKVKISALAKNEGSFSAIRFVPDGWTLESGKKYDVRVTKGKTVNHAFTVEPIDC